MNWSRSQKSLMKYKTLKHTKYRLLKTLQALLRDPNRQSKSMTATERCSKLSTKVIAHLIELQIGTSFHTSFVKVTKMGQHWTQQMVLHNTGVWPLQEFGTFPRREVSLDNLKITRARKNRRNVCQVCQLTLRVMVNMFARLTAPKYVKE